MRKILIGTVANGTEVEIDLDALSGYERLLTDQEVVIMLSSVGTPTGTVTLQGDKTGTEADARVYATLTDEDTGADVVSVTAVDQALLFNVKLPRFIQLLTTISAGQINVYALIS